MAEGFAGAAVLKRACSKIEEATGIKDVGLLVAGLALIGGIPGADLLLGEFVAREGFKMGAGRYPSAGELPDLRPLFDDGEPLDFSSTVFEASQENASQCAACGAPEREHRLRQDGCLPECPPKVVH
jgi:hypothetical protein